MPVLPGACGLCMGGPPAWGWQSCSIAGAAAEGSGRFDDRHEMLDRDNRMRISVNDGERP